MAIKREYQHLAAFVKTKLLRPGQKCEVSASFDLTDFAAYDEKTSSFILEKGEYVVRAGNSSRNTSAIATLSLESDCATEKCKEIRGARGRVDEIIAPAQADLNKDGAARALKINADSVTAKTNDYSSKGCEVLPEAEKMSDKELAYLCAGDPSLMRGGVLDVVGACGQINRKVCKKYGYAPAVMADGPAGLRLTREYAVEPNGKVRMRGRIPEDLTKAKKILAFIDDIWSRKSAKAVEVRQYCTAWPSETVQAQTFFPELIEREGRAISEEMKKFNVRIWLAPGLNIQRHPLCGRNFEYYSEEPVLTAKMASALTRGVQSDEKCAVTIKHYCCNNQENNRMRSSSEINERALREIYLKAFRLTIRNARPKCVMSSYNKVNGVYVNSSKELCIDVLRGEFGFNGVIMTDWQSVAPGQAKAGEVIAAQNDIVMAGDGYQLKELLGALRTGATDRRAFEESASRVLRLCRQLEGKK